MNKELTQLERDAAQLSTKDRARLIRRLIASLEPKDTGDIEQMWLDEAEKRLAAYRRGESPTRSGEEVFEEVLSQG